MPLIEEQKIELFEVGDPQIAAAGHRVAFREDHHELLLVEGNRGQPGVFKGKAQDCDVDTPLSEGIDQVVGLLLHNAGSVPSLRFIEGAQEIRKQERRDRRDHPHHQCAPQPAFHGVGMIDERVHALQRGVGKRQQRPPHRRHDDFSGGALDQLHSESLLEGRECLRERGLGNAQVRRGGAEVAVFRDRREGPDLRNGRPILFVGHSYLSMFQQC